MATGTTFIKCEIHSQIVYQTHKDETMTLHRTNAMLNLEDCSAHLGKVNVLLALPLPNKHVPPILEHQQLRRHFGEIRGDDQHRA